MNTVAIIQPSFLPWVGYFQIIASCNHFVFYDDVQYDRRSWRNRNKISSQNGPQWITVPVKNKGLYFQKINSTEIDYSTNWQKKILNTLQMNYSKFPFFKKYYSWIDESFAGNFKTICELDIKLTQDVCQFLDIKTSFHLSSSLPRPEGTNKIESLIFICKMLSAEIYISGPSAREYIGDSSAFKESAIKLCYANYNIPFEGSDPTSIIDLLFKYGPETKKFVQPLILT